MAYMWQDLVTYASEEGRKHGGDYREYTYEELAAETDRIVGEIWGWLGLRDDPELRAEIPRVDNRNYKWKQELTDEEVRTVERIAEEGMERFGYREA